MSSFDCGECAVMGGSDREGERLPAGDGDGRAAIVLGVHELAEIVFKRADIGAVE